MLREIIDLILNANVVEFTAMGNTIPIALDGSYKFSSESLQSALPFGRLRKLMQGP